MRIIAEWAQRQRSARTGHYPRRLQYVIAFLRIEFRHLDPVAPRERRTTGLAIDRSGKQRALMPGKPFEHVVVRFRPRLEIEFGLGQFLPEKVHFGGGSSPEQRR